ncbi:hypothetical protein Sps_05036 [Shewanella psychrophila]|uniref:Uncharacterized protein n=1 Tax=Shewanella psychrophila TaxID=225848 RepID=A0A1S6HXF5_9GAMM|nr:hypothetical protein [Shewanella psychrophila]AQS40114.1 hypothetical protein Sps_05036 [Shewanella psychrophila]
MKAAPSWQPITCLAAGLCADTSVRRSKYAPCMLYDSIHAAEAHSRIYTL